MSLVLCLPTEALLGLSSVFQSVQWRLGRMWCPSWEEIWKRWSLGFMPLTCSKSCSKRARCIWRSRPSVSAFRSSWRKSQLVWDLKEDRGATGQRAFWAAEDLLAAFTAYCCGATEKAMAPHPVLSPGKSRGRRSLGGCSPWGREESDTTEWLHFHFSLSCVGEGNGNPLQCSCLENPRDGGAWWAAVYGVAQSPTRLKRLSSSRCGAKALNVPLAQINESNLKQH